MSTAILKGYEALIPPWESRLDALYQAATPPPEMYRDGFGEAGHNASDTMRRIARQNGSLKLRDALQVRIQGGEWPAEMLDLLDWHRKTGPQIATADHPAEDTASQALPHGTEVPQVGNHSSDGATRVSAESFQTENHSNSQTA